PQLLPALCGLAYVHLVAIQALLPVYVGAGWFDDWWMHYDEALIFLGERSIHTTWFKDDAFNLASRTPLFNLVSAFLMSLVEECLVFLNDCLGSGESFLYRSGRAGAGGHGHAVAVLAVATQG